MTATFADDTLIQIRPGMDVSIVIPAYNEARRLPVTLAGWRVYLACQPFSSEVVVVDDGSRDATSEIATQAGARVIALWPNRGKGGAVKAGMLAAMGASIAYVDADLNIAPEHLGPALNLIDAEADLVAGQRDLSEYASAEGPVRLAAGGLVQLTRRALVREVSDIPDTQCGFKVFRQALARAVFARTRVTSFAFDIEVLFVARKLGARIVAMPVRTTYRDESTYNVRKHLPRLLRDVVAIRRNDRAGVYRG